MTGLSRSSTLARSLSLTKPLSFHRPQLTETAYKPAPRRPRPSHTRLRRWPGCGRPGKGVRARHRDGGVLPVPSPTLRGAPSPPLPSPPLPPLPSSTPPHAAKPGVFHSPSFK